MQKGGYFMHHLARNRMGTRAPLPNSPHPSSAAHKLFSTRFRCQQRM